MMHSPPRFSDFLRVFPEVKLPVVLSDESTLEFSRQNKPLSQGLIQTFIQPLEDHLPDELTEYIACFKIPDTKDFHALVYWRGSLMDYQYVMVTFDLRGEMIDRQVLAGTYSDGLTLTHSVATIEPDWNIVVVSGQNESDSHFDPTSSTARALELLPEGYIKLH